MDHSVPQMLVMAREIKEKDIRNHPDRNRLLKVMGIEWEEPAFKIEEPLRTDECQAILMCSDGFGNLLQKKKCVKYLKKQYRTGMD